MVQEEEAFIRAVLNADESTEIQYTDEGWDSRVYLVNRGTAVFKFPRSVEAQAQYANEIAALRLLAGGRGAVRTPTVEWVGEDARYFGYRGIIGAPLTDRMRGLTLERRTEIGAALGRFLSHLHALELPGAPVMDVEREIAEYQHKFEIAEPTVERRLNGQEVSAVASFFREELPDTMRRLGAELHLCHGDLGPWNIIVAPAGVVGVIDFGDVGYYDASKDFSGFGDDAVLRGALDAYGADANLREKSDLRIRAFPILDMPFYLGKGNGDGVTACLELARRTIVERVNTGATRVGRA